MFSLFLFSIKLILFSIISGVVSAKAVKAPHSRTPKIRLNDGHIIPIIGFGTAFITEAAVREAIDVGYRHFDTSLNYKESEKIIGKVIN